ncbi:hypothetical protein F4779DRAFT_475081 [Xylariaceae sp. FL0662B]|nr:hypothetical protein F4779DRAFT_475081 [Xylariaceae sp. FL0662B]
MSQARPGPVNSKFSRLFASRHWIPLIGTAIFATGMVVGVQYQRSALKRNEQTQKDAAENLYVSVDRSGGGV